MNDWQAMITIIVSILVPLGGLIIGMGTFLHRSLSKRIDRNSEDIKRNSETLRSLRRL